MALEVIGAGFGRTGTLSLKAALEQLGLGPCYHMYELLQHLDHATAWVDAAGGDLASLDRPLDGYRSTVDWPGCAFWRELAERHPDAKVVLTVRPPQRWYASFRETVGALLAAGQAEDRSSLPAEFVPVAEMRDLVVRDRSFGPDFDLDDADAVIAAYEEHNAAVRAEIAPDRLLEYDVAEGWGPLCAFLDVPVPATDFPEANDRARFRELFGLDLDDHRLADDGADAVQRRFASEVQPGATLTS